jgi:hypothetical protein
MNIFGNADESSPNQGEFLQASESENSTTYAKGPNLVRKNRSLARLIVSNQMTIYVSGLCICRCFVPRACNASHCHISTSCRIEAMIKVGLLCLWQKAMPHLETKYWEAIAFKVIIYFCKYFS